MTARTFRRQLKTLKLSQMELARRLGVVQSTVYRWAHGKTSVPESVALLLKAWAGK